MLQPLLASVTGMYESGSRMFLMVSSKLMAHVRSGHSKTHVSSRPDRSAKFIRRISSCCRISSSTSATHADLIPSASWHNKHMACRDTLAKTLVWLNVQVLLHVVRCKFGSKQQHQSHWLCFVPAAPTVLLAALTAVLASCSIKCDPNRELTAGVQPTAPLQIDIATVGQTFRRPQRWQS